MYDPWVVDGFLAILDQLERIDAKERELRGAELAESASIPAQLEVISATQAEEREFNELRRELPRSTSVAGAAEILFRHLRRVIPAATLTLYSHRNDSTDLTVTAWSGVGASALDGLTIAIGDRISGWAFAHKQVVVNSDASLELGPVAKTFSVPLRYALAAPIDGPFPGVITLYASEPFDKDHRRMIEAAATLFVSSLAASTITEPQGMVASADRSGTDPRKRSVH
jgi:hypothetical protein